MKRLPPRRAQRGVAAITAILIVAVAASAATMMLSQQAAMLDQTMLVASRAQADLFARAGIDWARGVVAEDSRLSNEYDGLDEAWAKPIAGLPVDRAVVAGVIADEQAKFNLNNLVNGVQKSAPDVAAFQRLLAALGLAPELADAVLDWIDADSDLSGPGGAEDAYYLAQARPYRAANTRMVQVEELYRVRGFDAAVVAKLRPYVTALKERTSVNANTAPEIVIAAVAPEIPKAKLASLMQQRKTAPFRSKQALWQWAGGSVEALDVKSANFSVRIRVQQDDIELATDALLSRGQNGVPAIAWRRPIY